MGGRRCRAASIELFAKRTSECHSPHYTARFGRDYSEDYFLVLRPTAVGRGQVIKEWQFPPSSLALVIDPRKAEEYRRMFPKEEARQLIEQNKFHMVQGRLNFDPRTRVATVTVTGLTTPFEAQVDLSRELSALKEN